MVDVPTGPVTPSAPVPIPPVAPTSAPRVLDDAAVHRAVAGDEAAFAAKPVEFDVVAATTAAMPDEPTIIDAKVQGITNHESDLYMPVTNETTRILLTFPIHFQNATRFNDNHNVLCYDVPFAYEPFWDAKPR